MGNHSIDLHLVIKAAIFLAKICAICVDKPVRLLSSISIDYYQSKYCIAYLFSCSCLINRSKSRTSFLRSNCASKTLHRRILSILLLRWPDKNWCNYPIIVKKMHTFFIKRSWYNNWNYQIFDNFIYRFKRFWL